NLNLRDFNVTAGDDGQVIGGLVGQNQGTIQNVTITGTVNAGSFSSVTAGGLVGLNSYDGIITGSRAAVNVTIGNGGADWGPSAVRAGGLVGQNFGQITQSHATGSVTGGGNTQLGGLVGENLGGAISTSYASGAVHSGSPDDFYASNIGGLIGSNTGTITGSYATGNVSNSGTSTTVV